MIVFHFSMTKSNFCATLNVYIFVEEETLLCAELRAEMYNGRHILWGVLSV